MRDLAETAGSALGRPTRETERADDARSTARLTSRVSKLTSSALDTPRLPELCVKMRPLTGKARGRTPRWCEETCNTRITVRRFDDCLILAQLASQASRSASVRVVLALAANLTDNLACSDRVPSFWASQTRQLTNTILMTTERARLTKLLPKNVDGKACRALCACRLPQLALVCSSEAF